MIVIRAAPITNNDLLDVAGCVTFPRENNTTKQSVDPDKQLNKAFEQVVLNSFQDSDTFLPTFRNYCCYSVCNRKLISVNWEPFATKKVICRFYLLLPKNFSECVSYMYLPLKHLRACQLCVVPRSAQA